MVQNRSFEDRLDHSIFNSDISIEATLPLSMMDRRSWPWKKKSSDKAAAEKSAATSDSAGPPTTSAVSQVNQGKQDNYKKPSYVQISVESYSHLTGLEDQVKSYEDQMKTLEDEVKELNEKLSAADSEMTTKENLVKQHAKVAEDAVSGAMLIRFQYTKQKANAVLISISTWNFMQFMKCWEKADSEALALKNNLESVTLLKLTAEDRASHLDGALKECMRQIRNLKEEHEQKLHDVVLARTRQWDKIKFELESKIASLDQELFRSAAENAAISRSLQERSNMLIKISEEKSQAEADIELLKSNIESCEREINSHKYELHIVSKELEIRNEEKNMSVRSADAANKQHLEGVKKIAKLEAECQRLRGLVRKKLPGPAALAQMKLEVENLGRDYGETRLRRSPIKPPSPYLSPFPEFSPESVHKYHKENELLAERLFAMEEETKMLKEALAKRNSELQASRNICAKTVNRLQSLEAQVQATSQQKSTAKPSVQIPIEGSFSQNLSLSLTSFSEDGNDDEISCAGSWVTGHSKKEKCIMSPDKTENANHLELMDDFLEMEKLAYLSINANQLVASSDVVNRDLVQISTGTDFQLKEQSELDPAENQELNVGLSAIDEKSLVDLPPLMKLQSRISTLFDPVPKDADINKVLEDIRHIVQDMHDSLHQDLLACSDATSDRQACPEDADLTAEKEISVSQDIQDLAEPAPQSITHELAAAVSQIYDFALLIGEEAKVVKGTSLDEDGLSLKLEELSVAFNEVVNRKLGLTEFVLCLSLVFSKAGKLRFNALSYNNNEAETNSPVCIDKVALPENKVVQESSGERFPNGCAHFSDPDIPHEGSVVPTSESNASSWKCSLEEFEKLKLEKDNMVMDLARCTENLESTESHLQETEQLLAEVKSQLTSTQKLNSLAETQLKCMAESYKSLETRAEALQTEINLLRAKTESLDNELLEERNRHQEALTRCKDFQEQLQRIENCPATDTDAKTNQGALATEFYVLEIMTEREITAATEKLAECQESIFLLGKQLKGMRPQSEFMGSPNYSERIIHKDDQGFKEEEEEPTICGTRSLQDIIDPGEVDSESPLHLYNIAPISPSDSEPKTLMRSPISSKHRPTMSTASSSSSSTPTPEKHSRGFSRFFSTKVKNDN
ncbi:hypothetical protein LguiA_006832 [Lonicera macranthoides]